MEKKELLFFVISPKNKLFVKGDKKLNFNINQLEELVMSNNYKQKNYINHELDDCPEAYKYGNLG
jgi:hypothetical protein